MNQTPHRTATQKVTDLLSSLHAIDQSGYYGENFLELRMIYNNLTALKMLYSNLDLDSSLAECYTFLDRAYQAARFRFDSRKDPGVIEHEHDIIVDTANVGKALSDMFPWDKEYSQLALEAYNELVRKGCIGSHEDSLTIKDLEKRCSRSV